MATTSLEWVRSADYGPTATPGDLLEFFGVPPSPETELDKNIREKRKYWKGKNNKARTGEARTFSAAVLQAISEAEDFLKRGASIDPSQAGAQDFSQRSSTISTIEELWREIESLLFRGRHGDAIDRMYRFEDEWGHTPRYRDMRALLVLSVLQDGGTAEQATVEQAIRDARSVLDALGPDEARYLTLIELLDASGSRREADQVFEEATTILPAPSGEFMARRLIIVARGGDADATLRFAISLIEGDPHDRALRSEVVQLLVNRAVERLLPLADDAACLLYERVIEVAAWVADGVPEAEDFVRPHRMWAANARQPIFAGNWQWRAFFGLISGFIALPIQNRLQSKPAWQVLQAGPPENKKDNRSARARDRAWFMVVNNAYIPAVHDEVRLPWQSVPGEWYPAEAVFDF